jgi:hypothetical protein
MFKFFISKEIGNNAVVIGCKPNNVDNLNNVRSGASGNFRTKRRHI